MKNTAETSLSHNFNEAVLEGAKNGEEHIAVQQLPRAGEDQHGRD